MLEMAKVAGVSNQTMYRRYGSKQGLFKALIEANASRAANTLDKALADDSSPSSAHGKVVARVTRCPRRCTVSPGRPPLSPSTTRNALCHFPEGSKVHFRWSLVEELESHSETVTRTGASGVPSTSGVCH
ncbi:MAG: TetR/AcrR family transcriptional regulator [Gulosibacter sp.]|uniref:TetR/AcrR family transcriptional regulator n=1 Tax=Gulosibacter sp. TaxID=2817531 RepID=UPI003F8ED2EE